MDDFGTCKSYNLLIFSLKTTFSGDVGVQHHPNITLNDTRSAPFYKGPAKRVMLVRSKNKNFLVEIFLQRPFKSVQSDLIFCFQMQVSLQGLEKKIQGHEKKLQGLLLKICQIDFRQGCFHYLSPTKI